MTPAQISRTPGQDGRSAELREAARRLGAGVGRRRFLTVTGAAAALAFATGLPGAGTAAAAELDARRITEDPFTLGVASGDPLPTSVLLWTRLAPRPYEADGGLPAERVEVRWEIARDERFRRTVRRGTATAHPEFGHSVHVDVRGLAPDQGLYYRFRAGDWTSPVGRTRTAPAPGARNSSLTLAAVSCQAYHDGYFTAYRHLADEDVDVVFHLGDYLYEYAVTAVGGARNYTDRVLPGHFNRETLTLDDYRMRYGLYKSDPDLRAAHAAHPFVVTWDDHETENNYAGDTSENSVPRRSSCCAGPPPTGRTGRTSRCAPRSVPPAPTCGSTAGSASAGSPSSTSSTPASTAATRPTATAGRSRAPSPRTRRAPWRAPPRNAG